MKVRIKLYFKSVFKNNDNKFAASGENATKISSAIKDGNKDVNGTEDGKFP